MTHLSSEFAGRIRSSVKQWFQNRMQECVHCRQCKGAVTPWDPYCPNCGQTDPVRIASSAVAYLVIGFVLLTVVLSSLIWAF